MRLVLLLLAVVLANGVLANLVWRMVGARSREVRVTGRTFALLFALANLFVAGVSLLHLWRSDWSWFYIVMLFQALAFAYRFGGATKGNYP